MNANKCSLNSKTRSLYDHPTTLENENAEIKKMSAEELLKNVNKEFIDTYGIEYFNKLFEVASAYYDSSMNQSDKIQVDKMDKYDYGYFCIIDATIDVDNDKHDIRLEMLFIKPDNKIIEFFETVT